jgi:hypothetical protein
MVRRFGPAVNAPDLGGVDLPVQNRVTVKAGVHRPSVPP